MDKRYRIVVVLDGDDNFPGGEPLELEFTAPSPEGAYAQLHAQMSPSVVWETQDDWEENGVLMSPSAVSQARVAFYKKYRELRVKNSAGVTYAEWLAAFGDEFEEDDRCRLCWREGEDPIEYRAWLRKVAPCSFCHATGFVGTNPCQECGSQGEKHVE